MCISLCAAKNVELSLGRGKVLGFETPGPALVACEQGSLWVTAPRTGDIVLGANERLTVEGPGRVVVQALAASRFVIAELPRPS